MADVAQTQTAPADMAQAATTFRRSHGSDLAARGEPFLWGMGGALAFGMTMIIGFVAMVLYFGLTTFWPKPIEVVTLVDGKVIAGEPLRQERYRPTADQLAAESETVRQAIAADLGFATRTLYHLGNYDFYGDDFRWVPDFQAKQTERPAGLVLVERQEWGAFIGHISAINVKGSKIEGDALTSEVLSAAHGEARARRERLHDIENGRIADVNREIESLRLQARRAVLDYGTGTPGQIAAQAEVDRRTAELQGGYTTLAAEAQLIKAEEAANTVTFQEIGGATKVYPLSTIVRYYAANDLGLGGDLAVYGARWWEYLTDEPREANTEGGVAPAIFGTVVMTLVMSLLVAPFGVITALYLREYAKQGRIVSIVRISVNNLAGVPSIVYGVFGLGFFAYILGGSIDSLFFPERLPSPTFGTGGLLWSALTLALLTVPVVIVATEEALSAVPRSMREGSLGCGASKWQTIRYIVLPRAAPGIMTGLILAMARGAGEVAPLMLVGVVKLAPQLPFDLHWPFAHLERSFMHLGFHIFDVGFQSRNSEAGRPMVFVTTLVLIVIVLLLNVSAIAIRNRLKRRFQGSQF
jgi:phosphate transport system permease protein